MNRKDLLGAAILLLIAGVYCWAKLRTVVLSRRERTVSRHA